MTQIDLAIAAVWITIVAFNSGLWYRMGYRTGRLDERLDHSRVEVEP